MKHQQQYQKQYLLKTSEQKKTTTRMKYNPQKIVNAMEAVESGTMNVTKASKVFDIPRQTLSDRIKGKYTKAGGKKDRTNRR